MDTQAKEKAASLQAHQARFLAQMETCSTWEPATIDLINHQTQATLRQIIMNIPDLVHPASKLFHTVNKMYSRDGFIFWFHPSQSQQVREVVAGLLVFLTGLWKGMINMAKFHKFFTDRAIERARDAWWDAETLCVATKADQEMTNILTYDMDLIFPETKVELEILGSSALASMIAKIQDNLLSTDPFLHSYWQQHPPQPPPEQCDEATCTQKPPSQKQKQQTRIQSQAQLPYQRAIFKSSSHGSHKP